MFYFDVVVNGGGGVFLKKAGAGKLFFFFTGGAKFERGGRIGSRWMECFVESPRGGNHIMCLSVRNPKQSGNKMTTVTP